MDDIIVEKGNRRTTYDFSQFSEESGKTLSISQKTGEPDGTFPKRPPSTMNAHFHKGKMDEFYVRRFDDEAEFEQLNLNRSTALDLPKGYELPVVIMDTMDTKDAPGKSYIFNFADGKISDGQDLKTGEAVSEELAKKTQSAVEDTYKQALAVIENGQNCDAIKNNPAYLAGCKEIKAGLEAELPKKIELPKALLDTAKDILADGQITNNEGYDHRKALHENGLRGYVATSTPSGHQTLNITVVENPAFKNNPPFDKQLNVHLGVSGTSSKIDPALLNLALESVKDMKLTEDEILGLARASDQESTILIEKLRHGQNQATVDLGQLKVSAPTDLPEIKSADPVSISK